MSDKTNAARLCDNAGVEYVLIPYETDDDNVDGKSVAKKLGLWEDEIFKTLVTIGKSGEIYVFVIPVSGELDLKKAAKASGEKSIHMLPLKELLTVTGYVKGGCSPLGMKKHYPTIFDETIILLDRITFNAGKVGLQLQLSVVDLNKVLTYNIAGLLKD
ncbi:MAG TPA: Cys-tRNA(Pro) deacylase [Tissierellaceae bacterium]|jgi:Cys-tRNA(Pro)/Cys-tRNA(Cys) deacylase|nr:Cys-tRNA(Pro) deacylase [Tissierellaceae bacterium]